jgi:hypothetical protein
LASKVRDALFSVFGESRLDPINTNFSSSEISKWKQSPKTAKCYKKLFIRINKNEEFTYMSRILEKVWPKADYSDELIAFAISICQTILNPANEAIQINEGIMKELIKENKVIFEIFRKFLKILFNSL